MNEQELKDMELNNFSGGSTIAYVVHRVPNGWNYIYFCAGTCATAVFVPEISIIQEHSVPRLRSF